MIFSSWAIPGNEREVIDIQNLLIDRGIEVITQNDGLVHTTGHPRREELKRLYDLVKPAVLVPVHGEAAHLEAHARLGRQHGIETVVHARNGDMVRLFPATTHFPGEVRTGELYLDGNVLCTPEESGVKGRRRLMFGGDVGFSEAYLDGDWSTPDLATLIEVAALNEQALSEITAGRRLARIAHRIKHLLRANTRRGSRRIELLPREFQMLEYLMRRQGRVVTRTMLLEGVWDYRFDPKTNVIDVHISRLRRKIDAEGEPPLIHTVRGSGYRLAAP